MTDNFDEFDQDQFDATEVNDGATAPEKSNGVKSLMNKPVVKLGIIVGVVGLAIAAALGAFSGGKETISAGMVQPPTINEVPGGPVTPFFNDQNKLANDQRVQEALDGKGSAMPTPIGKPVDASDFDALARKNAMEEFNAQTERLKREWRVEQQQNEQKMQALQQQMQQRAPQDDTLAQAMQKQMQQLMESWTPSKMKVVTGVEPISETKKSETTQGAVGVQSAMVQASSQQQKAKMLVPAGTVNYAQLLTEANSDVPGPIMVQILSGPFSGGRAIGRFTVMYEQLVMTFNLVVHKGKDYPINAIALDPDTTLGAMATDIDHRYMKRVLLPAAAGFMSEFGNALSSAGSQTTVTGDSVVINEVQKGYKEAAFEGLSKAGDTVARFLEQEAAQTKTLVRVTTGTAMGLFFLQSVTDQGLVASSLEQEPNSGASEAWAKAYQNSGYGVPDVSAYPRASMAAPAGPAGSANSTGGVRTPGGGATIYK